MITTIQAHPCNAATAAAAGFDVVTLPLEEDGYPSVAALEAARLGPHRRADGQQPRRHGDLQPAHPALGRPGPRGRRARVLRPRELQRRHDAACVRASSASTPACTCSTRRSACPRAAAGRRWARTAAARSWCDFLPRPLVRRDGDRYTLDHEGPRSIGRVREFWGNVPQVVKAYAWTRAMGAEGLRDAADLSVLALNYMDRRLMQVRGVTRAHPHLDAPRLEMTRYSLETVTEDTGITVFDVQNRMVDFGVDAFWLSHEPWLCPSRSRPSPASSGPRRTSTSGSTCSPTSSTRPTRARRS